MSVAAGATDHENGAVAHGPRRYGRGFGIPAPVDTLYPGYRLPLEESGWRMNASAVTRPRIGMTFS